MIRIPIEKMTKEEKLEAMELLWRDLTRDADAYESPAWHEEELRKTEERMDAGLEKPMTFEEAKRKLLRRRRNSRAK
jgi:hypothetical protein